MTAEAAAAVVAAVSASSIRAEAYRLVAQRSDVVTTLTLDQRAAELLALAEYVVSEAPEAEALAHALLRHLAVVPDPARFESLVDAVRDRDRFTDDPRGYAQALEWPLREDALDRLEQSLCVDVDAAIWSLLHDTPACRRCQQTRISNRWAPADWPRSAFCAEHRSQP